MTQLQSIMLLMASNYPLLSPLVNQANPMVIAIDLALNHTIDRPFSFNHFTESCPMQK
jgi:hypothetical protein